MIRLKMNVRRIAAALLTITALPAAGCATYVSPISKWRAAYDGSLFKRMTPEERGDSKSTDPGSFLQRWLTPRPMPKSTAAGPPASTLVLGSDGWRPLAKPAPDPQADSELDAAISLFQKGNFEEAEKQFTKIAKDRKGSTWGENASWYLAESQFQRKAYTKASDSYMKLYNEYPATNYKEKLVRREYELAQIWLSQSDPKLPAEKKLPLLAHFDGRLPLIDVQGSGIKELEHVRFNDPTGPLAEQAAIDLADFYYKHEDYETASVYYEQFIDEFSSKKSDFLQYAYLTAIDSRMKGYLGPEYDASGLEKARELVRRVYATYPESQAGNPKLITTLDHINEAEAEKAFNIGTYYKRAGKVASAEYYFGWIPQRWPRSPWAAKAKVELTALAKLPRKPSKPSKIIIPPGSNNPMGGGMMGGMMGGMPGMGMGMPGGMM